MPVSLVRGLTSELGILPLEGVLLAFRQDHQECRPSSLEVQVEHRRLRYSRMGCLLLVGEAPPGAFVLQPQGRTEAWAPQQAS